MSYPADPRIDNPRARPTESTFLNSEAVMSSCAPVSNPQSKLGPSFRISYSIKEVRAITGFSRVNIYENINSGALVARKNGRRTFVLATDLEEWLRTLPTVR
jgi:hypothetical protein